MASPGQVPPDFQSISALIKTMTNAQLKDILRSEGLAVSGVKVSLQLRIIDCQLSTQQHSARPCLENSHTGVPSSARFLGAKFTYRAY